MAEFKEYLRYDALGLAELVRRGEVPAADLVETAIARIERGNPRINAVIHPMYDAARAEAARVKPAAHAGPFAGVPFLAKDLLSTWAGVRQAHGMRLMAEWVAPRDSELVRRLRVAGLITVGKTSTPELGLLPITEPLLFGPTRNPWDPTRTPGGSSGGSGAAVAAGFVPMAGGGDGGGSIRIPASCCGLFGLKPTRGRTPAGPDVGESWQGCAVEHVLTRSVRDSAALLDAIAGMDVGSPYAAPPQARPFLDEVGAPPGRLRIGFTTRALLPAHVDAECVRAVEDTARLLGDLGHEITEDAPPLDGARFAIDFVHMLVGETAADVREMERLAGRRAGAGDLELETELLVKLGSALSAADFAQSVRNLKRLGRELADWFTRYDVLLTPTLALPPVPVGSLRPRGGERAMMHVATRLRAGRLFHKLGALSRIAANAWRFTPFTAPWNATGQPACSVPTHWSASGLPIGTQLVARFGGEATLFRLASQIEEARPWSNRRPPGFDA